MCVAAVKLGWDAIFLILQNSPQFKYILAGIQNLPLLWYTLSLFFIYNTLFNLFAPTVYVVSTIIQKNVHILSILCNPSTCIMYWYCIQCWNQSEYWVSEVISIGSNFNSEGFNLQGNYKTWDSGPHLTVSKLESTIGRGMTQTNFKDMLKNVENCVIIDPTLHDCHYVI